MSLDNLHPYQRKAMDLNAGIMGLGGLFGQGGQHPQGAQILTPYQNPFIQNGGGQNPFIQSGGQNPHLQVVDRDRYMGGRQQPPPGGWQLNQPQGPPRDIFGIRGMGEQIGGFGEQLGGFGEQMGGFGETLGGYQDLLGGYGEQLGGFGEQLGGFKDEFSGINDKLQNLEQGITSLTDKFGTQQQQQSPYQQNFGMNPFGSINPYTPFFGGLGAFMRRY